MRHIAKVCCICTLLVACTATADCGNDPESCSQYQDTTSLLQVRSNAYPGSQRLQADAERSRRTEAQREPTAVLDEEEQAEEKFVHSNRADQDPAPPADPAADPAPAAADPAPPAADAAAEAPGGNESGGNESGGNKSGGVPANWTDYLYAPLPKPIGPLISNGTEKEEKDIAKKSSQQELIGSLNKDASLDTQDYSEEEDKEESPAIITDAAANSSGNVSWKDYLPVHGQDFIVNWESEGETKELAALKNDSANVSANWTDYLPHNPSWIPYWVSKGATKEDLAEPEDLKAEVQEAIRATTRRRKNGTDASPENAIDAAEAADKAGVKTGWVDYAMPEYPAPLGE